MKNWILGWKKYVTYHDLWFEIREKRFIFMYLFSLCLLLIAFCCCWWFPFYGVQFITFGNERLPIELSTVFDVFPAMETPGIFKDLPKSLEMEAPGTSKFNSGTFRVSSYFTIKNKCKRRRLVCTKNPLKIPSTQENPWSQESFIVNNIETKNWLHFNTQLP